MCNNNYNILSFRLSMGKMLGEGAFGIVVQGEAMGICSKNTNTTVAVKMLKCKYSIFFKLYLCQDK